MFISIKVKGRFSEDLSEECLIDTSSVKMLIRKYGLFMIETDVGRFQIDESSYEDLRKAVYGVQKN